MKIIHRPLLVAALLLIRIGSAHAQLIDSYNADTLTLGSVTTWNDLAGTQNASTIDTANDPTAAKTNATFNGHTYVNFGSNSGLITSSALFSGGSNRSMAVVYDDPNGDNGGINPIVGQSGAGIQGTWFVLQARTAGVSGDPYLAGFIDDVNPGTTPIANRLTFALATYNGTTETLYWAYGLHGAVNSLSSIASPALNTVANPFTFGFDQGGETSAGDMQIGQVQVFGSSLTGAQATVEIQSLQAYYAAVPEPSTYAMLIVGLSFLGICIHRRQICQSSRIFCRS